MKIFSVLACWFVSSFAFAENVSPSVATPDVGPQDPAAELLVQQLGDENFEVRGVATEKLLKLSYAALRALKTASESKDPEARARILWLMRRAEAAFFARAEIQAWKKALADERASLKEGRLSGPLLGCSLVNTQNTNTAQPRVNPDPGEGLVGSALNWLVAAQEEDGHWDSKKFGSQQNADVEQTSLALLAFLGAGHTPRVGSYKANVRKAVDWLISRQREDGAIVQMGWEEVDGPTHALAAIALCEAAGMSNIPEINVAAQGATNYSTSVHQTHIKDKESGNLVCSGFGRAANSEPELFTSTLFTLHFKSAKVAGLQVPSESFDGLIQFLDSLKNSPDSYTEHGGKPGLYPWVPGGKTDVKATMCALLSRQFLGWKRDDLVGSVTLAAAACEPFIKENEKRDPLTHYIGTLVMFQQGGDLWKNWNDGRGALYLSEQIKEGANAGSWDPKGTWSGGGRVLTTAINTLCFEIYGRGELVITK